jgi:hypothetical protein
MALDMSHGENVAPELVYSIRISKVRKEIYVNSPLETASRRRRAYI